ncbi:hypothetical protein [Raineya sp.]|jgi:hypothetical protein
MYFTQKVRFQNLEDVLKIYKRQQRPLAEVLSFFTSEANRKKVEELYPQVKPLTVQEALLFENNEQRMLAMRLFSPQEIVENMKAIIIDKQTIHKKQIRWDKHLKPYTYEFMDTYILYEIKGKLFVTAENNRRNSFIDARNVYVVQCKCTSTGRVYFLYVPDEIGQKGDALEAIAWTMQINGKPITKEQYLNLMYSET